MKNIILLSSMVILVGNTYGQTATSTTSTTSTSKSIAEKVQLTLEVETATKRDGDNDIKGSETYLLVEPGFKVTKQFTALLGTQYKTRSMGGTKTDDESKNRDHLEEAYAKLLYKPTTFKKNGIADIRLQARAYTVQDDFFKRYYAADGNYQLRAYFGRPISGGFYINKYTSYVRYKNYFNNDYVNKYTRDYELRTRISPTYRLKSGIDLGTTITYNHIFKVQKLNDEENVDFDISARYQKGAYAVLGRVGFPVMNNNDGESVLKSNDDAGKEFGYALTFTAYL